MRGCFRKLERSDLCLAHADACPSRTLGTWAPELRLVRSARGEPSGAVDLTLRRHARPHTDTCTWENSASLAQSLIFLGRLGGCFLIFFLVPNLRVSSPRRGGKLLSRILFWVPCFKEIRFRFTGCGSPRFTSSPFFNAHGRLSEGCGLFAPGPAPRWAGRGGSCGGLSAAAEILPERRASLARPSCPDSTAPAASPRDGHPESPQPLPWNFRIL